jgi:release factor glutamine methyltransferase
MSSAAPVFNRPVFSRHAVGSVGHAQDEAAERLVKAGVDGARLDARLLVAHGLGRDPGWLIGHPEAMLTIDQLSEIAALVRRREAREPLAYILGVKEFWSLEFKVSPATLIPRPETETLVDVVLARMAERDAALRVLDLGTGSGCILLSILHERPNANGVGIDQRAAALDIARRNAATHGLSARSKFLEGDWWSALGVGESAGFDVVISNPPYITEAEMHELAPEIIEFEPHGALQAGVDGLDCYRQILPGLIGRLRPGGLFVGEIGYRQGDEALQLARDNGLEKLEIAADVAGLPRCLVGVMGNGGKN